MIKTILRNNIVLFYFLIGILLYLGLIFLCTKIDPNKVPNYSFFQLYVYMILAINIIGTGYFVFGFTFDYHILLNFSSDIVFKKYIFKSVINMIISSLIGYLGLFLSIYYFNNNFINDYIYLSFVNVIFNIPFNIILSIFSTKRFSLFDNKFIIAAQMPKSYIIFIAQCVWGAVFYYIFSKINYIYIIILLITEYLFFFVNINRIALYLKNKVKNEYIRSR